MTSEGSDGGKGGGAGMRHVCRQAGERSALATVIEACIGQNLGEFPLTAQPQRSGRPGSGDSPGQDAR